jgi:hypothetical protein
VRGAVCAGEDREHGSVSSHAVRKLKDEIDARMSGKIDVYREEERETQ